MNDTTNAADWSTPDGGRTDWFRSIRKARRLDDRAATNPPARAADNVSASLPSDPIELAALIDKLKKDASEAEDRLYLLRSELDALEARHALLSVLGGMPEPGVVIIGGCAMGVVTMFVVAAMT